MSTISLRLPESLHKQVRELALQEGISIDLLHKSPALNGRAVIEQIPACAGIGIRLRTTFFARAGGVLQG